MASKTNGHVDGEVNGVQKETATKVAGNIEGFTNVNEQDATQYLNNYKAHKKGISHEEMIRVYTDWADNYDKDLCPGRYNGPEIVAKEMTEFYAKSKRAAIKILDVAAGTGRVGQELSKTGFKKIDALEPSPGMIKVLTGRNIYKDTFTCSIGYGIIKEIEPNTYDCLVIAGGMGEGHIPVKAINEMIRVVRQGGTIFIVMREEYLEYVEEYAQKLEPYMKELQSQGFWKQVSRKTVPEYSFNKNGVVYVYEVLRPEYPS